MLITTPTDLVDVMLRKRNELDLTQIALSKLAKVPAEVISRAEAGTQMPNLNRLFQIFTALGLEWRVE